MVFILALPFSALFRLFSAFGIPITAHLHKVEPLSTFEAHHAHEALNAPLTTPSLH